MTMMMVMGLHHAIHHYVRAVHSSRFADWLP